MYALDDERVVRVLHHPDLQGVQRRHQLVAELLAGGAPFALPEVLEVGAVGGRTGRLSPRTSSTACPTWTRAPSCTSTSSPAPC